MVIIIISNQAHKLQEKGQLTLVYSKRTIWLASKKQFCSTTYLTI